METVTATDSNKELVRMILTVTANPLLELVYTDYQFRMGSNNRATGFKYRAGGKGINVSRQLAMFNTPSLAFLPMGGNTGKILRDVLEEENTKVIPVSVKSPVRTASVIMEQERVTTIFGTSYELSNADIASCIDKLAKVIVNTEIVSFSGSVPCPAAAEIYIQGIRLAKKFDKISFLDTYGDHLADCLKESPTVVHNNLDEISETFALGEGSESDILEVLSLLYGMEIKQSYITNGEKPLYASNFNYRYRIIPPAIKISDPTGSGDAFMAGIVFGWHNAMMFTDFFRLAVAMGMANAQSMDVCRVSREQAYYLLDSISLEQLGSKMKLIDDTATSH